MKTNRSSAFGFGSRWLLCLVAIAVGEEQKQPFQRNSIDDWGMGFSDCLERHAKGCEGFISEYGRVSKQEVKSLDYVIGVESPLTKVFKDKFMFHGRYVPEIRILAARNEAEAVQVCVIPVGNEKALEGVRLSVTDLRGPGTTIPGKDIEIDVVEYVQPEPVQYPVTYAGPWPDPLIPQGEKEAKVQPLELQPFWVEVHVPADARPGDYEGALKVTTSNSHELTVSFLLHVWSFALPSEIHIPITTNIRPGVFTASGDVQEEDAAFHRYVECFLKHRINVGPACSVPVPNDPAYEKLDKELEWAIGKGMSSFWLGLGGKEQKQKDEFVRLCKHLKEKGWLKHAWIQVGIDEPNAEHYPAVVEHAEEIKKLVPELKTLVTESPHPSLIGHVDIFGTDPCTEREEWNKKAKEAGEAVYYSLCHIPVRAQFLRPQHEAPNMILDVSAVFHRVVFWLAWANRIDGIMFWGGNSEWPKDMAKSWPAQTMPPRWPGDSVYSGVHNGNGITVYPGRNGTPWPSLRMKVIRDGSEDYEYLWLLRELLRKEDDEKHRKLLDLVPEICVTPTYFSHSPEGILSRRMELAIALDKLAQTLGNGSNLTK